MAATRPGWASEVTRATPDRAPRHERAEKGEPTGAVFGAQGLQAQDLPLALGVHTGSHQDVHAQAAPALADPHDQGVCLHEAVGATVDHGRGGGCGTAPSSSTSPVGSTGLPQRRNSQVDLLRHHREEITLALCLDDRHRLVGTAIVAVGWVQAARLSARPILAGFEACRATSSVLVGYRHYGALSATEAEQASFRTITAACGLHGLAVVDHVVVTTGGFSSAWSGGS